MGRDEITKAQEQGNKGNNKIPNAKDRKIITDVASHKQVTSYIVENDWKGLEDYIKRKTPDALGYKIVNDASFFEFIFGIPDVPPKVVSSLLSRVPQSCLQNFIGDEGPKYMTYAASTGKLNLIQILIDYNKDLPNTKDSLNTKDLPNTKDEEKCFLLPVQIAALYGQRKAVRRLLEVTTEPLDGSEGMVLLQYLINSNLFGVALRLLKTHSKIADVSVGEIGKILASLSKRPKAFASGNRHGFWKSLLYQWIPVHDEDNHHRRPHSKSVCGDLEKQLSVTSKIHSAFGSLHQKLKIVLWESLLQLAPSLKSIRDEKLKHRRTLEILRIVCAAAVHNLEEHHEAENVFKNPMFTAARLGIYEIVMGIMSSYFPWSLEFKNKDGQDIFMVAVKHRQEKVFNIIFNFQSSWSWVLANIEERKDNILHLAARSKPSSEVPGAALQMQRELQWFRAVEDYVHATFQDQRNNEGKTPRELFTEQHKELVKEGEEWMKKTAESCSVVATLIMTIAFAAAITVPGGSDNRGMPNYMREPSFTVFGISNAIALFSSVIAVLMFLGILTSRFSEEDFLASLPRKLIIGLITLFFSIACLMVAFAATVYIVQFHPWKWIIIPTGLLGFLPVFLFATLQFPLLVEVFASTYGSGIFHPMKFVGM